MILSGRTIQELGIMHPFYGRTKHKGLTFGCGPAGYDVRVEFDDKGLQECVQLLPGQFILASTIERFVMPPDVMGIVHDKSTWARMGLACQNTVIEPGWHGWLTIELSNHGTECLKIERGMPIAQVVFHRVDQPVEKTYDGKYHNQKRGPVQAILEKG